MTDPYSGDNFTDPQSQNILGEATKRRVFSPKDSSESHKKKEVGKKSKKKKTMNTGSLYREGIDEMAKHGILLELSSSGNHCNHRIYSQSLLTHGVNITDGIKPVRGINYPRNFTPKLPINLDGIDHIDRIICSWEPALQEFWLPLLKDKGKGTDLENYTNALLKARSEVDTQDIHEPLNYEQTFDPTGSLTGRGSSSNPRIWVPAREWFDSNLHSVKMKDVFTLFPKAELEILSLIIGRIAVGRSNHIPAGWEEPIKHTYRSAGVIIGKDPGTGKSILFNGFTAALSKCGFTTASFKNTTERFGLKSSALADVAYKDDTSLRSLRSFLESEETKILVTGGLFSVEEKFAKGEQIWPRCVILLNSNAWSPAFCYDLDPGIIDRVKLLSTYRKVELNRMPETMTGVSEGSPNAFPEYHIPWLAEKLGVDTEALFLWCLRLCADKFWEVISDKTDPTVNRLEKEIRWWTTRLRIKFKSDVRLSVINAMVISALIRRGESYIFTEISSSTFQEHLRDLYFVGTDPSCLELLAKMKERWESDGRSSTHYYSGFRELRWDSIPTAMREFPDASEVGFSTRSESDIIKAVVDKIIMRDGMKIGGGSTYITEDWSFVKYGIDELKDEAERLMSDMEPLAFERIRDENVKPQDGWLSHRYYSPDRAEELRKPAWEAMKSKISNSKKENQTSLSSH